MRYRYIDVFINMIFLQHFNNSRTYDGQIRNVQRIQNNPEQ